LRKTCVIERYKNKKRLFIEKRKMVKGKSTIVKDFEVFSKGVQRLEEIKKELDGLNVRGYGNEVASIRARLKNVSEIPSVEKDMKALKAKIYGGSGKTSAPVNKKIKQLETKIRAKRSISSQQSKNIKKVPVLQREITLLRNELQRQKDEERKKKELLRRIDPSVDLLTNEAFGLSLNEVKVELSNRLKNKEAEMQRQLHDDLVLREKSFNGKYKDLEGKYHQMYEERVERQLKKDVQKKFKELLNKKLKAKKAVLSKGELKALKIQAEKEFETSKLQLKNQLRNDLLIEKKKMKNSFEEELLVHKHQLHKKFEEKVLGEVRKLRKEQEDKKNFLEMDLEKKKKELAEERHKERQAILENQKRFLEGFKEKENKLEGRLERKGAKLNSTLKEKEMEELEMKKMGERIVKMNGDLKKLMDLKKKVHSEMQLRVRANERQIEEKNLARRKLEEKHRNVDKNLKEALMKEKKARESGEKKLVSVRKKEVANILALKEKLRRDLLVAKKREGVIRNKINAEADSKFMKKIEERRIELESFTKKKKKEMKEVILNKKSIEGRLRNKERLLRSQRVLNESLKKKEANLEKTIGDKQKEISKLVKDKEFGVDVELNAKLKKAKEKLMILSNEKARVRDEKAKTNEMKRKLLERQNEIEKRSQVEMARLESQRQKNAERFVEKTRELRERFEEDKNKKIHDVLKRKKEELHRQMRKEFEDKLKFELRKKEVEFEQKKIAIEQEIQNKAKMLFS
jgi:hypothetical protein